ncbi:hypothetical protein R3P38DRAFT_3212734 [Favolaschia claudopus]|uniref:Uncharacterized protein n=1 Tax=Favolaschia claudopus TaxID=2862362 RepID=A0AAW0ADW7_9AGAR
MLDGRGLHGPCRELTVESTAVPVTGTGGSPDSEHMDIPEPGPSSVFKSSEALKDSCLKSLTFSEWSGMSESQRMAIWATGCDIYIHDLHTGAPVRNLNQLRGALTRWNCMDIPVEVQEQGLRTFPENNSEAEINYTASIRTTTLDDHARA